jgi:hypothetical protein
MIRKNSTAKVKEISIFETDEDSQIQTGSKADEDKEKLKNIRKKEDD